MKLNLKLYRSEVVPVYTTDRGNKVVNGRQLQESLGITKDYSTWIKSKIKSHKFIKDIHYVVVGPEDELLVQGTLPQKGEQSKRGNNRKDYVFLLDAAKKIAMGTNNTQGDKVKDYFLECEKVAQNIYRFMLPNMMEHTRRDIQIENVKGVNSHLFLNQEKQTIADYHRDLSKLLINKYPTDLKKEAKEAGVPYKNRKSGRECMRYGYPQAACAASVCDTLVKGGKTLDEIAPVAKKLQDVFGDLLQLGFIPKELAA